MRNCQHQSGLQTATVQYTKVVPIDKISVVISMVLAFWILGEAVTAKAVIGGLLITAGTLLLIL